MKPTLRARPSAPRTTSLVVLAIAACALLGTAQAQVQQSRAGMAVAPLEGSLQPRVGIEAPGGVLVVAIQPEGPAETAGLRKGDVLVGADEEAIADPTTWLTKLTQRDPGTVVRLRVFRAGEIVSVNLELGPSAG